MQQNDRHSTTLSCVYTQVPDLRWSRDCLVEAYLPTMWFGGFLLTTPPFQLWPLKTSTSRSSQDCAQSDPVMVGRDLYRPSRSLEPTGPMRRGRPPQLEAPPPSSALSSPLSTIPPCAHLVHQDVCVLALEHFDPGLLVRTTGPPPASWQACPSPPGQPLQPPPRLSPTFPTYMHFILAQYCWQQPRNNLHHHSPSFYLSVQYKPTTNKYVSKPTTWLFHNWLHKCTFKCHSIAPILLMCPLLFC